MQIKIAWMTTDNEGKFKQGLAFSLEKYCISEALLNVLSVKRVEECPSFRSN